MGLASGLDQAEKLMFFGFAYQFPIDIHQKLIEQYSDFSLAF